MSHTPEPWKTDRTSSKSLDDEWEIFTESPINFIAEFIEKNNAQRIVACVNGCAGLNPAAYRACVEALRKAHSTISDECEGGVDHPVARLVFDALAHAEGGQP